MIAVILLGLLLQAEKPEQSKPLYLSIGHLTEITLPEPYLSVEFPIPKIVDIKNNGGGFDN